jgi:hypothetical protein
MKDTASHQKKNSNPNYLLFDETEDPEFQAQTVTRMAFVEPKQPEGEIKNIEKLYNKVLSKWPSVIRHSGVL